MAESLHADLLAISGVASAEIDRETGPPIEVQVQLGSGADPAMVGAEIRTVLATHGLQSLDNEDGSSDDGKPLTPGFQGRLVRSKSTPNAAPSSVTVESDGFAVLLSDDIDSPVQASRRGIESVAVEEGRNGVALTVSGSAGSVSRRVGSAGRALDAALVAAAVEMAAVEANLTAISRATTEGSDLVTVLLEVAGSGRRVGSAVVAGGEAFAIVQAAWQAATEQG